jgi:hypothetical protein
MKTACKINGLTKTLIYFMSKKSNSVETHMDIPNKGLRIFARPLI